MRDGVALQPPGWCFSLKLSLQLLVVFLFHLFGITTVSSLNGDFYSAGDVIELTGHTIQGATRGYSSRWNVNYPDPSISRYLSAYGVALSHDGNTAYVGEAYKNRILSVDLENGAVTYLAGGTRGLQDGPAAMAKFSWPYGVALSPDSATLYVADSGNDCVRALSLASGIVSTVAGGGSGSRGFHDGSAEKARFAWPYGLTVSPDGNTIYVADSGNNRIRAIDIYSGLVSTVAGAGNAGYQDGPALQSRFYGPRGVAASPDGSVIYVADYSNFRVRALRLADHSVSTVFGGGVEIYRPAGVAVTADGSYVFAADTANSKVRGVRLIARRDEVSKTSSLDRHTPQTSGWPTKPLDIDLDGERIVLEEEQLISTTALPTGSNWTRESELLISSVPAPPRSRRRGDFVWNHELSADGAIDELHLRHAITAVILFLVLALMGAVGIVAGALWQRRNALLMLQYYQNSASHIHSQHSVHRHSQHPPPRHSHSQHAHFADVNHQHHPEKHEIALNMSPHIDNEDNTSNSSTNSTTRSDPYQSQCITKQNYVRTLSLDQTPTIVHLRDVKQSQPQQMYLNQQQSSVIKRVSSSVWPENQEMRPMQSQRSKELGTVFRRSNNPLPLDTDILSSGHCN